MLTIDEFISDELRWELHSLIDGFTQVSDVLAMVDDYIRKRDALSDLPLDQLIAQIKTEAEEAYKNSQGGK